MVLPFSNGSDAPRSYNSLENPIGIETLTVISSHLTH